MKVHGKRTSAVLRCFKYTNNRGVQLLHSPGPPKTGVCTLNSVRIGWGYVYKRHVGASFKTAQPENPPFPGWHSFRPEKSQAPFFGGVSDAEPFSPRCLKVREKWMFAVLHFEVHSKSLLYANINIMVRISILGVDLVMRDLLIK